MGKGGGPEDSETLTVVVCIPRTAVKPLALGAELTKLICAWLCRNFFKLFFLTFKKPFFPSVLLLFFKTHFSLLSFPYSFSGNGFVIY